MFLSLLISCFTQSSQDQLVPIVILHGLTQSNESMLLVQERLETNTGAYVKNCEIGNGRDSTLIMAFDQMLEELYHCINNDSKLKDGFIGVGYSQGGILMRSYLQLYNHKGYKMKRFISIAGPLGGFYCGNHSDCWIFGPLPQKLQTLMHNHAYDFVTQTLIGPSQYWRDPYNLEKYQENCWMLPLLDNLNEYNMTLKNNFKSVDKIIMFGGPNDGVISPWQSTFFGQWAAGSDTNVVLYNDRDEYHLDLFGLRTMDQQGRLIMITTDIPHQQYVKSQDFIDNMLTQYCIINKNDQK